MTKFSEKNEVRGNIGKQENNKNEFSKFMS